jgi:hypothetical protein
VSRTADATVDAIDVEFKHPGSRSRRGLRPDSTTVLNAAGEGIGQSRHLVFDLRGQQFTTEDGRRAARRVAGRYADELDSFRIVWDGSDGPEGIVWMGGRP